MASPPDKYAHVKLEGLTLKPDEPWFLLRGQDIFTPEMMRYYASALLTAGRTEMAADVRSHADAVEAWQLLHPEFVKTPD